MSAVWVGVDVGGTKVYAAVVSIDGRVLQSVRTETPGRREDPQILEDTVVRAVEEVSAGSPVAGVGLAAAGFVDAERESVRFAPHLPWRGEPVRRLLQDRLGVPVALDNDANCAALAESAYGAGRGAELMLMVTLGTGIGGAIVWNGRLLRGHHGMAGEFGHMQVVPDGRECPCGRSGCWEQYCSGTALVRFGRSRLQQSPVLMTTAGNDPAQLSGPALTQAARNADPIALAAFGEMAHWLGVGTANLVAALDPDVLVVGGGLAAVGDLLLAPARETFERMLVGAGHREPARLVVAALGPEAGAVGAARLVQEQVGQDPRA